MVGGTSTHLDDTLASQYQSINWTQHTIILVSLQAVLQLGNLLAPGTMFEETSHETNLDLDSWFDLH